MAHPARVDRPRRAVDRDAHGILEPRRDAVRPAEVHPGAERDRRELDIATCDPVDDLVDRPVAADGHDEPSAVADCTPRQFDEMSRPLGEQRLAREAEAFGAMGELRPALAGGAVRRRRVDQEDGGLSQRSRLRARSSSSGRPPRGAPRP